MKTAMTIGFFDGVHLGHQEILKLLRKRNSHATILTFSNHPRSIIKPPAPPLLIPLSQKIDLLKQYADEVILLPFTMELAATPYEELLSRFDLSHLILGAGSAFGRNREGNETNLRELAKKKGFTVEYAPKLLLDGEPISSSRIRKAIASNELTLATRLLGRPI